MLGQAGSGSAGSVVRQEADARRAWDTDEHGFAWVGQRVSVSVTARPRDPQLRGLVFPFEFIQDFAHEFPESVPDSVRAFLPRVVGMYLLNSSGCT